MTADAPRRRTWIPHETFSHRLASRGAVERFNDEGTIAVGFTPPRGSPLVMAFDGAQSDTLSLWRTRSETGFLSSPKVEVDVLSIRFVLEGAMVRRDLRREYGARRGYALMMSFDLMREEEASAGFEGLTTSFSRAAMLAAHRALEGREVPTLPDFASVAEVAGTPMLALLQTVKRLHADLGRGVREPDLVFPMLQEVMAYQVLSAWPRTGVQSGLQIAPQPPARPEPGSPRTLRRAKDHIEANLARKLLLSEVAAAAGVGVRRLQAAFRQETGETPVQYILKRRLDRVRDDLRSPENGSLPVRAVAERWGFTHMGDFGRMYRGRFGVTPGAERGGR